MPSVSKPQATLMAIAAHHPAFAKKKGIPLKVAREFNQADKRTGILRKHKGGALLGRPGAMTSTMPLLGHAMSGTQLGQADALIRKVQHAFADGGSVKAEKSELSAKQRKDIRDSIERGKTSAISSLRATRSMLMASAPPPSSAEDASSQLASLSGRLAAKSMQPGSPAAMYAEYQHLMSQIHDETIDPKQQMAAVDRLAQISAQLDQLGVPVQEPA